MKNILVPTDFSLTSKNAVLYAIHFAQQLGVSKVILYNAYQAQLTIDPPIPATVLLDEKQLHKESMDALQKFKSHLVDYCPKGVTLEVHCEYGSLANGLDEACAATGSGLIVMGITGGGILKEKLVGSNAISVARHSTIQTIIVPPDAVFTHIEDIALLSDFDEVMESTPDAFITSLVKATGAQLHVINIEDETGRTDISTSKVLEESYAMHNLLKELNPEYHFIRGSDFMDAVNDFSNEHGIDLIITIPKKQGFFDTLFTPSFTKKLAFHSNVPLLIIRK